MKKKILFWSIFSVSLLGNLIALSIFLYGYSFYKSMSSGSSGSPGQPGGNGSPDAKVLDIVTTEVDGYKNSHIIATYNGQRIVLANSSIYSVAGHESKPVNIGDVIKVVESKMDMGVIKMLSYKVAR